MEFSNLTKEQRQYMVLGGLVGAIVIYALFAFGLRPFVEEWGDINREYAELQNKLDDGRRNVNRTSSLLHNLDSSFTNLVHLAEEYIAPKENAYSWVTEKIYHQARDLNIEVETISEYSPNIPWKSVPSVNREFGAYGVRMITACGYNELRKLIVHFEESNPLLVISGVSVSSTPGDLENHRVQIFLEWPIWTSPEGERVIRSSDLSKAKVSST